MAKNMANYGVLTKNCGKIWHISKFCIKTIPKNMAHKKKMAAKIWRKSKKYGTCHINMAMWQHCIPNIARRKTLFGGSSGIFAKRSVLFRRGIFAEKLVLSV